MENWNTLPEEIVKARSLKSNLKNTMKIEKFQIRASKIPHGFSSLSYTERLKIFNIHSLKDWRVKGDLIEMFKVIIGLDEIEWAKFSLLRIDIGPAQGVRGNKLSLRRNTFESKIRNNCAPSVKQRHNFFSNSVVPRWN